MTPMEFLYIKALVSAADAARPAPWIGANNDQVFGATLGLSAREIEELKSREAIK